MSARGDEDSKVKLYMNSNPNIHRAATNRNRTFILNPDRLSTFERKPSL